MHASRDELPELLGAVLLDRLLVRLRHSCACVGTKRDAGGGPVPRASSPKRARPSTPPRARSADVTSGPFLLTRGEYDRTGSVRRIALRREGGDCRRRARRQSGQADILQCRADGTCGRAAPLRERVPTLTVDSLASGWPARQG